MNKLEELVKKHRALLEYNPVLPKEVVDVLVDHMKEACIQYALSIVALPIKIYVTNRDTMEQERWDNIMTSIKAAHMKEIYSDDKDLFTNTSHYDPRRSIGENRGDGTVD